MGSKFDLAEPRSLFDADRLTSAVKELHQIFSSIITIDQTYAIGEHEPIFDRQGASGIHFAASPRWNESLDSAFDELDFSWLDRKVLS